MDKATLVLSDGTAYVGRAFGARGETTGLLSFTTRVVGLIEGLTDPRYRGHMVVHTFPAVGGYGVIPQDLITDRVQASAVVVRDWVEHPSNWRAQGNLDGFLKEQGVPGICGIDTRSLMIKLRRAGAMMGSLRQGEAAHWPEGVPGGEEKRALGATKNLPAAGPLHIAGGGPKVAVVDLGLGEELAKALGARGADVTLIAPGEWAGKAYDAFALSDGPEEFHSLDLTSLPSGIPVYAQGVGHLAFARARGGLVTLMTAQHGGANLPVKWGDKVYITDQFHAHCVTGIPESAKEVVRNLNDGTVEALAYEDALTVQFAPSTQEGPHDMGWVYDRFLRMLANCGLPATSASP